MPSIQYQYNQLTSPFAKAMLILFCGGLLSACGGGSSTTRSPPQEQVPTPTPTKPIDQSLTITATMPMQVHNAEFSIEIMGDVEPLYKNVNFNNFYTEINNLDFTKYRNKILLVTIKGHDKTTMYDPILNKMVGFKGSMHALAVVNSTDMRIVITPSTEAIYQRTLVRSNQFDPQSVDLSLISLAHLQKSTSEINSSLMDSFNYITTIIPHFSNQQSISTLKLTENNKTPYLNLFHGLGLMYSLKQKFPETENTFLELAQHLGTDLRDGFLDGRSIKGNKTVFKPFVIAPQNTNPLNNSLLKIGELQKTIRENFALELKTSALHYAQQYAFQNTLNPQGIQEFEKYAYIPKISPLDSNSRFRWQGAGDYRPAFGLKTLESCSNDVNPCRQGLNVDDTTTYVNDVEYLIGTHQLNQCTIHFYPSGDVSISQGKDIYRSSINRDLSDNLQQINNDPSHYILNVGASENKSAYILQFEIKDMNIIKARTGYNQNIYSTTIEKSEMNCGD